jgi:hypothetical protein
VHLLHAAAASVLGRDRLNPNDLQKGNCHMELKFTSLILECSDLHQWDREGFSMPVLAKAKKL